MSQVVCCAKLSMIVPWAMWLHSQWMEHLWQVNGNPVHAPNACTNTPMASIRLDRLQVPFFKSLVWPNRE